MYIRVYAPDGEPFDVTRERADTLILQNGWTQTPPKKQTKKASQKRSYTVESEQDSGATDSVEE